MLVRTGADFELSLAEYFKERLTTFGRQLRPPPQEDTYWYLGNMLARFGNSDQVFCYEEGSLSLRPLALLYGDALHAPSHHERCLILRQLGDLALFLGAVFPGVFSRRGLQTDYVIGMGGSAYDYLAENAQKQQHVYSELSSTFTQLLQLVAQACAKENQFDASDVFILYQRYQKTKDPVAAQQLRALGIVLGEDDRLQ